MDSVELVVILITILALIGVVSNFSYVYTEDKAAEQQQIQSAVTAVANEKSDRLSNVKYVVDQLNGVTGDIAGTISSNQSNFSTFQKAYGTSNIAVSSYITINNGGVQKSIFDLPGTGNVNMQLMQNVTAMMGITASNLTPAGNSAQFCFGPDTKNCIKFPDSNGNTVLTAPTNGSIVLNAPLKTDNSVFVNGQLTTSNVISICPTSGLTSSCSTIQVDPSNNLTISSPASASVKVNGLNISSNVSTGGAYVNGLQISTDGKDMTLQSPTNGSVIMKGSWKLDQSATLVNSSSKSVAFVA